MSSPANRRRNQPRSTSAMCRTRPSSEIVDGSTARRASCPASSPSHFSCSVSRWQRRNSLSVVRSSLWGSHADRDYWRARAANRRDAARPRSVSATAVPRHRQRTQPCHPAVAFKTPRPAHRMTPTFYGPGASDPLLDAVRKRQMPVIGGGTGIWSFIEITDAAAATLAAVDRGAPDVYNSEGVPDDGGDAAGNRLPEIGAGTVGGGRGGLAARTGRRARRRAGPAEHAELADSLSMVFLVMLEALSPVERAVFMLREVFGYGYPDVARITGKAEVNCRQIFAPRQHIAAGGQARGSAPPPARRAEGEELARGSSRPPRAATWTRCSAWSRPTWCSTGTAAPRRRRSGSRWPGGSASCGCSSACSAGAGSSAPPSGWPGSTASRAL